jgi:hypothetical protein
MTVADKKKTWRTVQIPDGLVGEIEKYLKTAEAERRGFHTVSGFIVHSVRKELGLG